MDGINITYSCKKLDGTASSATISWDNNTHKLTTNNIDSQTYCTVNFTSTSVVDFDYTGGEQTITLPNTGNYKLEVWGAQGGNAMNSANYGGSGGGGGYYGGGGSVLAPASGGSGYIGNSLLISYSSITKHMMCYDQDTMTTCSLSQETNIKTESYACSSATANANCSKDGNGYVRITYLNS